MEANGKRLMANPMVVLREEFDDWAVLFDPDTNKGYGLNPIGVFIWKQLDGKHTPAKILEELKSNCDEIPEDAEVYIHTFLQDLVKNGLAGYEVQGA
ncbi:SynChlorMet cassette protein ScmD [Acidobacteriota bacterium]